MGTYNASAYNDNHTLLKLILNIQDYLHKNPNVALYHTVGFQGTVATTSIPKDKVYGPAGSTNTPTAGDLILYALDLGQGFFQVGGADEDNYTGEYIGQTLTGPKGDPGPEGPEGPEGPAGTPGVKLYYTTGFRGTVATTSIPKDKVHGPTGSTTTPIIGDVILYALDLGQGYFIVSGADASNYIGSYIGQTVQGEKGDPGTPGAAATITVGTVTTGDPTTPAAVSNVGTENAAVFNFTIPRGEKGDKGDPGTGYSQLTGLYFNRQNDSVTYSDGIAVFVGQFQLTTADGNSTFANGAVTLPIMAGAGIIIDASEDGRSLIIKAAPTEYVISGGYGHCKNNNPAAVADEGTAYVATITANSGYNFGTGYTLTVTMGGADITSEVAVVSTDTISINIPSVTGDIYINCVAVEIPPKLATPAIAMNADGKTLEITDVANATSYDVYVDGTLKTNVTSAPNTTTLDLSTLPDITDGTHTVKVKAKADGYIDSEFSNEVSYTKAPARSFANDSPAVIQAAVIDGTAINLYNVGDEKEITLTDGSTITIRIVNNSASMYQLSDGSRNTGFVLEFVDCFKVLQYMNSSNTKTGGWNSSYMRNTMMNTIFNLLPSEWQNVIPLVNVISDNGAYPSPTTVTSSDKLFLPAEREVSITSYRDSDINSSSKVEWDALQNWSYYSSGGSRIKKYNNQNYQYWLRSPAWSNTSKFCSISDNGSFATTLASGTLGVAPAFCL